MTPRPKDVAVVTIIALVIVYGVRNHGGVGAPSAVTQATYVYEKDQGTAPDPVEKAIDTLNRQGIMASQFEKDTKNGEGQVPTQYVVALKAATEAGLPAFVVQAGEKVRSVVPKPTTEAEVLEAVK